MSYKPSILVADDHELVRRNYSKALGLAGYQTFVADGAEQALSVIKRERLDLALIDVFMGGRDIGYDLCKAFSSKGVLSPGVFLMSSVLTDEQDRLRAYRAGAATFLVKPDNLGVLVRHVQDFMADPAPLLQLSRSKQARRQTGLEANAVLVVDDDETMAHAACLSLESEGFLPYAASSWSEAMLLAHKIRPKAIVLDVSLPEVDGVTLMRMLRARPATRRTPILMLTGSDKPGLELQCLRQGADDFIIKGVHDLSALPVRITRLLNAKPESEVLQCGSLRIDPSSRGVWVGSRQLKELTPREFDLLAYLIKKSPAVVSWLDVQRDVWKTAVDELKPSRETPTIAVHCERLREKLGAASVCLVVHRGVGLQLDPARLN